MPAIDFKDRKTDPHFLESGPFYERNLELEKKALAEYPEENLLLGPLVIDLDSTNWCRSLLGITPERKRKIGPWFVKTPPGH